MSFQLTDLQFTRGERRLLGPLSLELPGQELIGVVGPNGSGKSTLLRLLYGFLTASRGSVNLGGDELSRISPLELVKRVGACPQEAEASLDFVAEQALALATRGDTGQARQRVENYPFLRLESLWGRRLSQLSGGEKQRIRLARAFLPEPDWLVLDEPANHLDLATGWALMEHLASRQTAGGVIVALHDLGAAVRFCHRLLVLDEGRLVAFAAPQEALSAQVLRDVFGLQAEVLKEARGWRLSVAGVTGG